jgi:long-chain acyl-CoA synthetase
VIGDRRPHVVALIALDPPAGEAADSNVRAAVAGAVERANAQLPESGRIRRFHLLADAWAPGGAELTPTLKLRRAAVHARYAAQIDAPYSA